MERTFLTQEQVAFPAPFAELNRYDVYDSSCSKAARVYYVDHDGGYYLKSAPKGSLAREAELERFFFGKGLGPQVLAYESLQEDWLLTRRVAGEDCLDRMYLDDPKRLCDVTAELLRMLHSTDITGCPVPNRTEEYLARARRSYELGAYDTTLFPDNWGYATAEDAWAVVETQGKLLKADTLLHGDFCLPNIVLNNWQFSGFIDLDSGGVGDRHVDLFWGQWSLQFNLKTDAYRERFLDAYGRQDIEPSLFPVVAAIEVFS